jgi:hypothetical protein
MLCTFLINKKGGDEHEMPVSIVRLQMGIKNRQEAKVLSTMQDIPMGEKTIMEKAIVVRPMVEKEARDCVDRINENMNDVRSLVYDLYVREGWSALGYESWRECVTKEFQQNERYLYRELESAQAEKNICQICQNTKIPDSQLHALTKLRNEPEKQREAYQQAIDTAPEGKITAALVKKIVKEILDQESPPILKATPPINKQELVSPEFQSAFDMMVVELKNARAMKWRDTSHKGAIGLMQILLTIVEQ